MEKKRDGRPDCKDRWANKIYYQASDLVKLKAVRMCEWDADDISTFLRVQIDPIYDLNQVWRDVPGCDLVADPALDDHHRHCGHVHQYWMQVILVCWGYLSHLTMVHIWGVPLLNALVLAMSWCTQCEDPMWLFFVRSLANTNCKGCFHCQFCRSDNKCQVKLNNSENNETVQWASPLYGLHI